MNERSCVSRVCAVAGVDSRLWGLSLLSGWAKRMLRWPVEGSTVIRMLPRCLEGLSSSMSPVERTLRKACSSSLANWSWSIAIVVTTARATRVYLCHAQATCCVAFRGSQLSRVNR